MIDSISQIKDILVCPVTKESLIFSGTSFNSSNVEYKINLDYGYPDFIPYDLKDLKDPMWKTWEQLQSNGEVSYENEPERNLGIGPRSDYIQFSKFCDLNGMVLDIGVGPQTSPTHLMYSEKRDFTFIGIDPLVGTQPREFPFVLGLGEYLPFQNDCFDQTLFVTSLDHFIEPIKALAEAKRVTKISGEICVWIGEKSKDALPPLVSPGWYSSLTVPEGADDPFHLNRFTLIEFEEFFKSLNLRVSKSEEIVVDHWRKNLFFKLKK